MNKTIERLCANSIWLFVFALCVGWFGIAGWMPLLSPDMSAQEIAAHYQDNASRIRFGATLMGIGTIFWWSFAGAIATQMKRIEGEHAPLTRIQMASSSGTVLIILIEAWLLLSLTFRTDIEPSAVRLTSDFIWLTFVGFYPPGLMQNLVIGLCILTDRRADPIFPRWVGYANFWLAFLFLPGGYIAFFKTGPFAWDGILGFWVIAIAFFAWIFMMWWAVTRAIRRA